ncbi:hypothetical protein MAR_006675 [Mya arenaria]|uniref:Uncharacterized protein n=1 Tax=Mya arenaria TaxID=6604 RepID=A0ABY7DCV4_MYAAR|nr:hypothetical protein MAR_006675 [Mya arenaria]
MVILFRRRTSRAKTTGRENQFTHMSIIEVQDESSTVGSYETPVQGDQTKHDYDPLRFSTYVQSKDNDINYIENAHEI